MTNDHFAYLLEALLSMPQGHRFAAAGFRMVEMGTSAIGLSPWPLT